MTLKERERDERIPAGSLLCHSCKCSGSRYGNPWSKSVAYGGFAISSLWVSAVWVVLKGPTPWTCYCNSRPAPQSKPSRDWGVETHTEDECGWARAVRHIHQVTLSWITRGDNYPIVLLFRYSCIIQSKFMSLLLVDSCGLNYAQPQYIFNHISSSILIIKPVIIFSES